MDLLQQHKLLQLKVLLTSVFGLKSRRFLIFQEPELNPKEFTSWNALIGLVNAIYKDENDSKTRMEGVIEHLEKKFSKPSRIYKKLLKHLREKRLFRENYIFFDRFPFSDFRILDTSCFPGVYKKNNKILEVVHERSNLEENQTHVIFKINSKFAFAEGIELIDLVYMSATSLFVFSRELKSMEVGDNNIFIESSLYSFLKFHNLKPREFGYKSSFPFTYGQKIENNEKLFWLVINVSDIGKFKTSYMNQGTLPYHHYLSSRMSLVASYSATLDKHPSKKPVIYTKNWSEWSKKAMYRMQIYSMIEASCYATKLQKELRFKYYLKPMKEKAKRKGKEVKKTSLNYYRKSQWGSSKNSEDLQDTIFFRKDINFNPSVKFSFELFGKKLTFLLEDFRFLFPKLSPDASNFFSTKFTARSSFQVFLFLLPLAILQTNSSVTGLINPLEKFIEKIVGELSDHDIENIDFNAEMYDVIMDELNTLTKKKINSGFMEKTDEYFHDDPISYIRRGTYFSITRKRFNENEDLKNYLKKTEDLVLVDEDDLSNYGGQILMHVRSELIDRRKKPFHVFYDADDYFSMEYLLAESKLGVDGSETGVKPIRFSYPPREYTCYVNETSEKWKMFFEFYSTRYHVRKDSVVGRQLKTWFLIINRQIVFTGDETRNKIQQLFEIMDFESINPDDFFFNRKGWDSELKVVNYLYLFKLFEKTLKGENNELLNAFLE